MSQSSRKTSTTESRRSKRRGSTGRHELIGRDVVYKGRVWRVVSAQANADPHGSPWLTLRRSGRVEVIAKSYELEQAMN